MYIICYSAQQAGYFDAALERYMKAVEYVEYCSDDGEYAAARQALLTAGYPNLSLNHQVHVISVFSSLST